MNPELTPAERNRLVNLLGMLGSDHDGEVTNAGRLAARLLQKRGLMWDQVVADRAVQSYRPPPRPASGADARADLELCARHPDQLTAWELSFVVALGRQGYPITSRQAAKLAQIAGKLRRWGLG